MTLESGACARPEPTGACCTFGDAVAPHLDRMHQTARRILRSDDQAWDAVQVTLLRLWRGHGLPEHPCGVLVSVVRSVSLEIRRGDRRRVEHESKADGLAPGVALDPAGDLVAADLHRLIEDALRELPTECREAVAARLGAEAGAGLNYVQIADQLGVPVGTVRSRLHRARRLLATQLCESVVA